MKGGNRCVAKVGEVGEGAVCEFLADDFGIGVGEGVGFDGAEGVLEVSHDVGEGWFVGGIERGDGFV